VNKTTIEWTDYSWPIVNGCRRISPGCGGPAHKGGCYAERLIATRLRKQPKYEGLATFDDKGPHWTGKSRLWVPDLDAPAAVKTPSKVFVADMGDLFFEAVSTAEIMAVFAVMAMTPWHSYQVLTKRPERMRAIISHLAKVDPEDAVGACVAALFDVHPTSTVGSSKTTKPALAAYARMGLPYDRCYWPLPNVWLGVSVEDQQRADERIPELLQTPAALRFLSCEPLLEPIHLRNLQANDPPVEIDALAGTHGFNRPHLGQNNAIDWVIAGGESGPGARACDVDWLRALVRQCRGAGVPIFVKQLGTFVRWDGISTSAEPWKPARFKPIDGFVRVELVDRKGGDPSEWPKDLRRREFPAPSATWPALRKALAAVDERP